MSTPAASSSAGCSRSLEVLYGPAGELPIGQFVVSDVGSDHFLIPANGRDKVTARPKFVAQKIRILRSTFCAIHIELFPFIYPMI